MYSHNRRNAHTSPVLPDTDPPIEPIASVSAANLKPEATTIAPSTREKPRPTRKSSPCPVCGDTKGKCRTFSDSPIVLCATAGSHESPPGYRFIKSGSHIWNVFAPSNDSQGDDRWKLAQQQQELQRERQERDRLAKLPTLQERHDWLSAKPRLLTPEQNADLLRRGLTQAEIDSSLSRGWMWEESSGYGIGAIDPITGLTVGAQIARDNRSPKYLWALAGQTNLRETGQNPLFCWISPDFDRTQPYTLNFCEGALKPLVSALKAWRSDAQQVWIGAAGGIFQREAVARAIGGLPIPQSHILWPDGGAVANHHVMRGYQGLHDALLSLGRRLEIAWWGQISKSDPDCDELGGGESIDVLSWENFTATAAGHIPKPNILPWLQAAWASLSNPIQCGDALRRRVEQATGHEYDPGMRLSTWKEAIEAGHRFILDTSGTGEGKSHTAGEVQPSEFGVDRVWFVSETHHNPTTNSLSDGWDDLIPRHRGNVIEATPNGSKRVRRAKPGEIRSEAGNCSRVGAIAALRAKHVSGADTADLVCGGCPMREACIHSEGSGFGYLKRRRESLAARRLRLHPDSAPNPRDYDLNRSLLIWDEPDSSFRSKREIPVILADIDQTIAALATHHPHLFDQSRALLEMLRSLLDGSQPLPYHGLSHSDILAKLPEIKHIDVAAIGAALEPDLGFLNPTQEHGVDIADLPSSLRRRFAPSSYEASEAAAATVVKQWLPDLLAVASGRTPGASLRITRDGLMIALPDDRHRQLVRSAAAVIFLDATLSKEDLALMIGCDPSEIYQCQQRRNKLGNLKILQIPDLGRLGQQRRDGAQQRVTALTEEFYRRYPHGSPIDFKRYADQGTGAWWRDSRGSNDFLGNEALLLVGTPCRNLGDLLADYCAQLGSIVDLEDEGFKQWVDRRIHADMLQGVGRLRANRRPGEALHVVIVSSFDLGDEIDGAPIERIRAVDFCLAAGTATERMMKAAAAAAAELKARGHKLTQAAIAAAAGLSRSWIAKWWESLRSTIVISASYNDRDKNRDGGSDWIEVLAAILRSGGGDDASPGVNFGYCLESGARWDFDDDDGGTDF